MNRGKLMVAMAKTKVERENQHGFAERVPEKKYVVFDYETVEELSNKNLNHIESSTDEEVALLKDNFGSCIENKNYPSAQDLEEFIKKTAISRTVPVTKAKLQQLFEKSDM
ncbi:hypothetical protein JTB14_027051 [Gonioctena quinquepunctata]|nr:hypothetical protein JTB14_027051 [Gonioctena quinquepunctata]